MIWTDCDREGENIGSEIVEVCRQVRPQIEVKRAKFSSIIASQLHHACRTAGELDWKQAYAVDARAELDLRIGAAFTRYQTMQLQARFPAADLKMISYGSCQFPTLGFVVEQYLKVHRFVPETFWSINVSHTADGETVKFNWKRNHLFDHRLCLVLYEMCIDQPTARVKTVSQQPTKKYKPLPLTTVELQKAGTRLLHIDSKQVMDIAEKLYQSGWISYPRTETDQFDKKMDLHGLIIKQTTDEAWGQYAQGLLDGGFRAPRMGPNNDGAHPPIHPTMHTSTLAGNDKRVYDYIVQRFLACCSEDAKGFLTKVDIEIAGEFFGTSGLVVLERNYLEIFTYDKWEGSTIPQFTQGDTFIPTSTMMEQGKTSPPKYLTETDLITLMNQNGIGTDATIAEHINTVQQRGYVFKQGSRPEYLLPSTLGIGLVEGYDKIGLDKSLSKPFLRRQMESKLLEICQGSTTKAEVVYEQIELYRMMYIMTRNRMNTIISSVSQRLEEGRQRAGGQGTGVVSIVNLGGSRGRGSSTRGSSSTRRGQGQGQSRSSSSTRGRGSSRSGQTTRSRGGQRGRGRGRGTAAAA